MAEGTEESPVIFTSYMDDAHGGDTNGDGSATSPAPGDWDEIDISGTNNASVFDYCEFYYGGGDYDDYTMVLFDDTKVTVSNCTFAQNKGEENGTLDAGKAGSGTTITGNAFYSNEKPLRINKNFSLDDSNSFHDPDDGNTGNTYNGIFIGYQGSNNYIDGQITWEETEVPFVFNYRGFHIEPGHSLTLSNDVIVKFNGGYVWYEGDNLLNHDGQGVWFTSYKDDAHGGDSNGNGSLTSPAEGDWEGIENVGASPTYWEAWENILYDEIH